MTDKTPPSAAQTDTFDLSRVAWVSDKDDLRHLLSALQDAPAVVYDLETTGLDEHAVTHGPSNGGVAARIVLASFTLPRYTDHGEVDGEPSTYLVALSHPESPWMGKWRRVSRLLAGAMKRSRGVLVGHNVKYDHRWMFATTGVDLSHRPLWDTQISSHLLDETTSTKLEERAPDTFGIDRWGDVDLTYPGAAEDEPLFKLGEYAARDTYWTWKLYENHRARMLPDAGEELFGEEIEEARLGQLAQYVAMPTTATLTAIEQRGLRLDVPWVEGMIRELEEEHERLFADLSTRYASEELAEASPSFAPTSRWFQEWARIAEERDDLRVLALTPSGKPQWSKQVLKKLARQGFETAESMLQLRAASKQLEFLRAWLEMVTPEERIHTTYNAGSVRTGRLSSSGPNLQQVTYALRPAFVPSEGYYLVDLDYSQIELRVAAFIAQCVPMIEAFKAGDDLHTLLAARINDKAPEDVTKEERQSGKSANFGLLYGMGVAGFKDYAEDVYGVHFSDQEAAVVHETFFEMWDGIRQWHLRSMKRAHDLGQVVSPIGRVRRLPDIWDGNEQVVGHAERNSVNSPVQGFASDIMQIAAACIEGNVHDVPAIPDVRLVGTVHDSILVEVRADRWEEASLACKRVMEEEVPLVLEKMGCVFDIPLVADATCGTRWGLSDVGEL